ncbi:MAG: AsmA family protein [candidate division NC10 bacterium]|nr:AsmA family protein [candidate division NC10 bacterium]
MRIEKGSLAYRDGKTKRVTRLTLDRLDLRAKDVTSPLTIDFAGAYAGRPFVLAGTVGPLSELQALSRPYPVKLALKAGGAAIEAEGTIARPMEGTGLDLKVSAQGQDVAEVARLVGKAVPALGPFAVTAKVTGSPQALSASGIEASLGKSHLAGSGTIWIAGPRPRVKAQLTSTLVDLSELLPREGARRTGAAASQKTPAPSGDKRVFPADPLPLSVLKTADADLDLKVDRLVLPNTFSVEGLAARVALSGGRLEVQPFGTRIGGGAVTGQIALDASSEKTASLAAKVDAKAIDLNQVLRQMGNPALVTGVKTDVALTLRGSGGSVRDLMAGLNGDLLLVLGEGRIHSKFIEWLGADLLTQIAERLSPTGKADLYTELKCGVMRFGAKDGVAISDRTIAFETSKMTLVSSGTANLKTEAIDFSLRPDTRQMLGIGAGELVKLLRVRGTLAEPMIGVDELGVGRTALSIGAAVATGGLSFLAEALAKRVMADPRPCETALGRTPAPARTGSAPSAAAPAGQEPPKTGRGIEQFFRGLFGR